MHRTCRAVFGVALLLLLAVPALAEKIRIEKADDLPRHTYQVDARAAAIVTDPQLLLDLSRAVEEDLRADLERYEIDDKSTLKNYYQTLGAVAMLEGRYDEYRELLAEVVRLEDKEAQRLVAGLVSLAWIEASSEVETPFEEAFGRALRTRVNDLPYEKVEAIIKQQKGMFEIVSQPLIEGMMDAQLQPVLDQSDGTLTKDMALTLVSQGFAVQMFLPHKAILVEVFDEYLKARAEVKPDIWAARDVDLGGREDLTETVVAIWDSGVDEDIFERIGLLWTNADEVADNRTDDDGNGLVDDLHGIYWDLHSSLTDLPMYPVEEVDDRALLQRRLKGLRDVQMNIESEEATELKQVMGGMTQDEVKPFIEGIGAYGNHSHGTHVAGIATAGNPAARVLNARITFDHRMIPEKMTLEQAQAMGESVTRTVAYFRENGVRVVNMSWGGSVADFEENLAQHNDPADPVERKELAREMFEILEGSLTEAMTGAPEILFVAAAGNSNNDNVFEEFVPSSIGVPNMLTVGAVDQAGDETSFTTFGKVDVYANGFNVESYVPGGDRMPLSGTSMASPNVTNLAAKILAVRPDLDPAAVRQIIVETADEQAAGERTVRLMNPTRALEVAEAELTQSRR